MWIKIINDGLSDDYESKSKQIGSLFIVVGIITSIYTLFSVLSTSAVLGVTLTTVGLISAYCTAKMNLHTPASWIKSLLIFISGLLFLFINMSTLSTIAIIIGLFLFLEALNNLYLAYMTRKDATVYAWLLNALISITFAAIILSSRETIPADAIGLLVSLSLIADGFTVIFSGRKIFIRP